MYLDLRTKHILIVNASTIVVIAQCRDKGNDGCSHQRASWSDGVRGVADDADDMGGANLLTLGVRGGGVILVIAVISTEGAVSIAINGRLLSAAALT